MIDNSPVECRECGCLMEPDPSQYKDGEGYICNECSSSSLDAED